MVHAHTFFSDNEKAEISQAVEKVEACTSGEIVVMVVDQSDDYPEASLTAGVVLGGILSLLISDLFLAGSLWSFIPIFLLSALGLGWLAKSIPSIKRTFSSRTRRETRVQERALTSFYDKGLYKTRDETGVLFFISLFERRVWVLADKGIYEKIAQETLQEYAHDIARGIRSGEAANSLCREIQAVGKVLAHFFPIKTDDENELANEIIVD